MQCPKCGLEATIVNSCTRVSGDNSPEEKTRVYTVQEFSCQNPACENHGKPLGQAEHLIYEG